MPRRSAAHPEDMHHSGHSMILTCIRTQHFSIIGHTTEIIALSATKAAQELLCLVFRRPLDGLGCLDVEILATGPIPKLGHTTYASFSANLQTHPPCMLYLRHMSKMCWM